MSADSTAACTPSLALPRKREREYAVYAFGKLPVGALPMGSYRHDIAYTAALKSCQNRAMGSYRHDIAYTAALKSCQNRAMGSYRHDIAYTAALKSDWTAALTDRSGWKRGNGNGRSGKRIRGTYAG